MNKVFKDYLDEQCIEIINQYNTYTGSELKCHIKDVLVQIILDAVHDTDIINSCFDYVNLKLAENCNPDA